jgi:hypothetical protein
MPVTAPRKRYGCKDTFESKQFWWITTNILRIRRGLAHANTLADNPTLVQLHSERKELLQMLMVNTILTNLREQRDRVITRAQIRQQLTAEDFDLRGIAETQNLTSSPFNFTYPKDQ